MPTATSSFTVNSVLKDPTNRTAMYRVLEYDTNRNQVRIVRAGKDGSIHGLVKKTEGVWMDGNVASGWNVIGHTDQALPKPVKQAAKPVAVKATATQKKAHTTSVSNIGNRDEVLQFIASWHRTMASSLEELLAK